MVDRLRLRIEETTGGTLTSLEKVGSGSSTTHTLAVAATRITLTRARQQVVNLSRFAGHFPIIGMRAAVVRLAHRAAGLRELIR